MSFEDLSDDDEAVHSAPPLTRERDDFENLLERISNELMQLNATINSIQKLTETGATKSAYQRLEQRAAAQNEAFRDRLVQLAKLNEDPRFKNSKSHRTKLERLVRDVQATGQRFRRSLSKLDEALSNVELGIQPQSTDSRHNSTIEVKLQLLPLEQSHTEMLALEHELTQLTDMFTTLATLVHEDNERLELIEENVQQASENVKSAVVDLQQAATYGAFVVPIAGAVVGGLVGGPLGIFVGAKGASLLGSVFVGGLLGYGAFSQLSKAKTAAINETAATAPASSATQ